MSKFLDATQDEILERNHKALAYSTKAEFRRIHKERQFDRMVKRLFWFSVGLWLWAVTLALLVGAV